MEKAKIDSVQLLALILLYEIGVSFALNLASDAGKNAWIAVLISMCIGVILFLLYFQLWKLYPDELPSTYTNKIVGNFFGKIITFLYIVYFLYISSNILRNFGDLLLSFSYQYTPLSVVNGMMMVVVIYACYKGIETIARTAEISSMIFYTLLVIALILIAVADIFEFENLQPLFRDNWAATFKTVFTQTIFVPFGEVVTFLYILPYVNDKKKVPIMGVVAIIITGLNLALIVSINIAVLSATYAQVIPFPLLRTIQLISIADFIERLDVLFLMAIFIGAFFKLLVYVYVALIASTDLFKLKSYKKLIYPFGIIILFMSMTIASNISEQIQEGLKVIPLYLQFPFQVIIPILLLCIGLWKNRNKLRKQRENQQNQNEENNNHSETSEQKENYVGYNLEN